MQQMLILISDALEVLDRAIKRLQINVAQLKGIEVLTFWCEKRGETRRREAQWDSGTG